jgi:hypothetical protein
VLRAVILIVTFIYPFVECRYADFSYAECRGTLSGENRLKKFCESKFIFAELDLKSFKRETV